MSFEVIAVLPFRLVEGVGQPRKHRVEGDAAAGVPLRIEEHLDMAHVLLGHAREIGIGEVEEVPARVQHRHPGVVDIEEVLQRVEAVGGPDRVDIGIGQRDAVAPGERHHHLGLERPLDVKMELRLRHRRDEAVKPCLIHAVPAGINCATRTLQEIGDNRKRTLQEADPTPATSAPFMCQARRSRLGR